MNKNLVAGCEIFSVYVSMDHSLLRQKVQVAYHIDLVANATCLLVTQLSVSSYQS